MRGEPARDDLRQDGHEQAGRADARDSPGANRNRQPVLGEEAEQQRADRGEPASNGHRPTGADLVAEHAPHDRQARVEDHEHRGDETDIGVAHTERLTNRFERDRRKSLTAQDDSLR